MLRSGAAKGIFLLVTTGFLGVVLLSAPLSVGAQNPINICLTADFSGVLASIGLVETPVIEMAVKEVNAAGGIKGRPIKLFIQDNASDPAKTVGSLKMFKDLNKCVANIAIVNSSNGLAAKPWAEQNRIPIISPDPATDRLTQSEGKAWFFRTEIPVSARVVTSLLRLKALRLDKVSFEGSTLATGTDALAVLKESAPKFNINVAGEVLVEPGTKDLTIQAMRLRDAGAQAVVSQEYEAELGAWARALKTIGWNPYMYFCSAAVFANTLATNPPELFEGWEVSQQIDTEKPLFRTVVKKYEAFTGKRFEDERIARTWDAIQLLFEAIKLSDNPDAPEAIRDALYRIKNFPLAVGRLESVGSFEIGRNHLLTEKDMVMYVVKSGKLVLAK
jgi:branched-chain amino acid transport system substrate-binding protein